MSALSETVHRLIDFRFSENVDVHTWLELCEPDVQVHLRQNEGTPGQGPVQYKGINNLVNGTLERMKWLSLIFRARISEDRTWTRDVRILQTINLTPTSLRTTAEVVFYTVPIIPKNIALLNNSDHHLETGTWVFEAEFSGNRLVSRLVEHRLSVRETVKRLQESQHWSTPESPEGSTEVVVSISPSFNAHKARNCHRFVEVLRTYQRFFGIPVEILLLSFLGRDFECREDTTTQSIASVQRAEESPEILPGKVRKRPLAWINAEADLDSLSRKQSVMSSMATLCPLLELEVFDGSSAAMETPFVQQLGRNPTPGERKDTIRRHNTLNARKSRRRKAAFDAFLTCTIDALETAIAKSAGSEEELSPAADADSVSSPEACLCSGADVHSSTAFARHVILAVVRMLCCKHDRRGAWDSLCDPDVRLSVFCVAWEKGQGVPDISDVRYDQQSSFHGLEGVISEIERRNNFLDTVWGSPDWSSEVTEQLTQRRARTASLRRSFTWRMCLAHLTKVEVELQCEVEMSVNTIGKVTDIRFSYDVEDFINQSKRVAFDVFGVVAKKPVRKMFQSSPVVSLARDRLYQAWRLLSIRRRHLFALEDLLQICAPNIQYRGPPSSHKQRLGDEGAVQELVGVDALMDDTRQLQRYIQEVVSKEYKMVNIAILPDTVIQNWREDTMVFSFCVIFYDYSRRNRLGLPGASPQLTSVTNSCVAVFEEMTASVVRIQEILDIHASRTLRYDEQILLALQHRETPVTSNICITGPTRSRPIKASHLNFAVLKLKRFISLRHSNLLRDEYLRDICSPIAQISFFLDNRRQPGTLNKFVGHYSFEGVKEFSNWSKVRSETLLSLLPHDGRTTYTLFVDVKFRTDNLYSEMSNENELLVNFGYETSVFAVPLAQGSATNIVTDKSHWVRLLNGLSHVSAVFNEQGVIRWCSEHIEVLQRFNPVMLNQSETAEPVDEIGSGPSLDGHKEVNKEAVCGHENGGDNRAEEVIPPI